MVLLFARDPADNSLWDYAMRRGWEENVRVVTDPDGLPPLVRAAKVEVGGSVSHLLQVLKEFVGYEVALIVPSRGIDTHKLSPPSKRVTWRTGIARAAGKSERVTSLAYGAFE